MISGEGKDGIDAEGGGGEYISHNRHAAAVPAGDLEDGLHPRLLEVDAQSQGGCFQARGLHIRHVDGMDLALQQPGGGQLLAEIGTLGRGHLRRDGERAAL